MEAVLMVMAVAVMVMEVMKVMFAEPLAGGSL